MKILVINGISALRGGGQTNLINFMKYLPQYECKVIFILNSKNIDLFSQYASKQIELYEAKDASKSIFHRVFWERFILPKKLKEWDADVYYTPGGTMTTKVPEKCTAITPLQNMLPFEDSERKRFPFFSYLRFKLLLLRFVFLKSYKMSDKVIFISKYSREAVKKYLPNIEEKSTVIPLGISDLFIDNQEKYDLPKELINNEFYLYVSNLDYYKAQKELIYTWKKLVDGGFKYPLVLVGPNVGKYGDEVLELIQELSLDENVIYLGTVVYEKLPSLYNASRALIFASSCECCPNILLEKLASSKMIFCSDKGPMPEFAEDGVVYFDPYDADSLMNKINEIEKNPKIMEEFSEKSLKLSIKYQYHSTIMKNIEYILNIKK
jgi:glycosyltransferase involved in cell wall biosynthesis